MFFTYSIIVSGAVFICAGSSVNGAAEAFGADRGTSRSRGTGLD